MGEPLGKSTSGIDPKGRRPSSLFGSVTDRLPVSECVYRG